YDQVMVLEGERARLRRVWLGWGGKRGEDSERAVGRGVEAEAMRGEGGSLGERTEEYLRREFSEKLKVSYGSLGVGGGKEADDIPRPKTCMSFGRTSRTAATVLQKFRQNAGTTNATTIPTEISQEKAIANGADLSLMWTSSTPYSSTSLREKRH